MKHYNSNKFVSGMAGNVAIIGLVAAVAVAGTFMSIFKWNKGAEKAPVKMEQKKEVKPVTNKSDDMKSIEADLEASVSGIDEQNF